MANGFSLSFKTELPNTKVHRSLFNNAHYKHLMNRKAEKNNWFPPKKRTAVEIENHQMKLELQRRDDQIQLWSKTFSVLSFMAVFVMMFYALIS